MGAASLGRRAARRRERAPRRRHKWHFEVDASWSHLSKPWNVAQKRERGRLTTGAWAGGKAGVGRGTPLPLGMFFVSVGCKGLRSTILESVAAKEVRSRERSLHVRCSLPSYLRASGTSVLTGWSLSEEWGLGHLSPWCVSEGLTGMALFL